VSTMRYRGVAKRRRGGWTLLLSKLRRPFLQAENGLEIEAGRVFSRYGKEGVWLWIHTFGLKEEKRVGGETRNRGVVLCLRMRGARAADRSRERGGLRETRTALC